MAAARESYGKRSAMALNMSGGMREWRFRGQARRAPMWRVLRDILYNAVDARVTGNLPV